MIGSCFYFLGTQIRSSAYVGLKIAVVFCRFVSDSVVHLSAFISYLLAFCGSRLCSTKFENCVTIFWCDFYHRKDNSEFTGSVHHKVSDHLETGIQMEWVYGSNDTKFAVASKYSPDKDTTVRVSRRRHIPSRDQVVSVPYCWHHCTKNRVIGQFLFLNS